MEGTHLKTLHQPTLKLPQNQTQLILLAHKRESANNKHPPAPNEVGYAFPGDLVERVVLGVVRVRPV